MKETATAARKAMNEFFQTRVHLNVWIKVKKSWSSDEASLVLRSSNFCPTLEACRILDLDTRFVCRHLTEKPTTDLLRQIHPKLRFTRNYESLRPNAPYCEEMIILDE